MDMREKIARALLPHTEFNSTDEWADTEAQAKCYAMADAVLEAMRSPTKAMLEAVDDEADDKMVARGRAYSAWTAMLDAARTKESV